MIHVNSLASTFAYGSMATLFLGDPKRFLTLLDQYDERLLRRLWKESARTTGLTTTEGEIPVVEQEERHPRGGRTVILRLPSSNLAQDPSRMLLVDDPRGARLYAQAGRDQDLYDVRQIYQKGYSQLGSIKDANLRAFCTLVDTVWRNQEDHRIWASRREQIATAMSLAALDDNDGHGDG